MSMTPSQVRFRQSPVATRILLGMKQSDMIAQELMPKVPQQLSSLLIARVGNEAFQRYNLKRSPGTATTRININFKGTVYTVEQKAVAIPIPFETMREMETSEVLNVGLHIEVATIAIKTASDILALDYELDTADLLKDPASYPAANVHTLTGLSKWSDYEHSDPVRDVEDASDQIRQAVGKRPNKMAISASVYKVLKNHPKILARLPANMHQKITVEHLQVVFDIPKIVVGEAIWKDETATSHDVWGDFVQLSFVGGLSNGVVTDVSMAEPYFGITNEIEGHPFVREPYYDEDTDSWIFKATHERKPNILMPEAAFLLDSPI